MSAGVYALCDPNTDEVMYVGQAADIDKRFLQHVANPTDATNLAKGFWIASLKASGLRPRLHVLETFGVVEQHAINVAERRWIRHYKSIGQARFNLAAGGSHRGVAHMLNSTLEQWQTAMRLFQKVDSDVSALAAAISKAGAGARHVDKLIALASKLRGVRYRLEDEVTRMHPTWAGRITPPASEQPPSEPPPGS